MVVRIDGRLELLKLTEVEEMLMFQPPDPELEWLLDPEPREAIPDNPVT